MFLIARPRKGIVAPLSGDSVSSFAICCFREGEAVELAFLTSPVCGDTAPGVPIPTEPRCPSSLSMVDTRLQTSRMVAA